MKILQINTVVNSGSTGRIAEEIGLEVMTQGHKSYIAYGRRDRPSKSNLIKIGAKKDVYLHGIKTLLTDQHGLGSYNATKSLIKEIKNIKPNIIHLHNIHGYYINYKILFQCIKGNNIPIVWTLHDCWTFTGHCAHFEHISCLKWMSHCEKCPLYNKYPRSFVDRSYNNFDDKKEAFQNVQNLTIVAPSKWLKNLVEQSYLKDYPVNVINNGVDLKIFCPPKLKTNSRIILGVASTWSNSKGLNDFIKLREIFDDDIKIVLIGLSKSQIKSLPKNILGISRTENIKELTEWYQKATVFVNPTYLDNFPTTNLEALACGTPVVTYDTGGSPESINSSIGETVEQGNNDLLKKAIERFLNDEDLKNLMIACRNHALKYFNKEERYKEYLEIYNSIKT
jgi:glycosyltransferase involved in cell wall biosynthesis